MYEHIIPIQVEEDDRDSNSDSDQKLSKSIEKLSVKQVERGKKPFVHVKPAINIQEEYLKEYDKFEERSFVSEYTLPNANVKEKIILIIDRGQDENFTPFLINNTKFSPLSMVKRAVSIFISLKHVINKLHEFAIMVLNENNASLVLNFTSDTRKLRDTLNKINECEAEDIFDLKSVFEIIDNITELPSSIVDEFPPPYVVRSIIFYGRSITVPELTATREVLKYMHNRYFTCDILMTHEPVEASNNCNKIFEILQNLDQKGTAYFFPVCRDIRRLHRSTGKLLAHPLQRPIQKLIKS